MATGKVFERHKQAWTTDEVQKLHMLAKKGMALKGLAKALTRSEESIKNSREGRRAGNREAALRGPRPATVRRRRYVAALRLDWQKLLHQITREPRRAERLGIKAAPGSTSPRPAPLRRV